MCFERLPNEILLEIFEFLNGFELLRAFYNLNSRLNFLLYNQFQSYRFNFLSVSKYDFDLFCQQHCPFIADRIILIHLSNNEHTSRQIELFLSSISSFNQFTQLRSLSISSFIFSSEILINIINQCQDLHHLTHVYLSNCDILYDRQDFQLLMNNIWNLSKLIYYHFSMNSEEFIDFCMPRRISTSLKKLSMWNNELNLEEISQLFKYTPHLQYLRITIRDYSNDTTDIPSSYLFLTNLDVRICGLPKNLTTTLFQNLPNLRCLNVELMLDIINGHQWEHIICTCFPKLKIFRLKMEKTIHDSLDIQQEANILFDSFGNSFWLDEHQWYIRLWIRDGSIHIHTLSTAYDYVDDVPLTTWKSTCPLDDQQKFYDNVHHIMDAVFFERSLPSDIRLPNIYHLSIQFPINEQFWSIVPSLDRLHTLQILAYHDSFHSQLYTLLNRIAFHHLVSLTIGYDLSFPSEISFFDYRNLTVEKLGLSMCNYFFNDQQCLALCHSSLGSLCQMLYIYIDNRKNIINLVKNMPKLQLLHVVSQDDKYSDQFYSRESDNEFSEETLLLTDDELIKWMKDYLGSTFVVIRDLSFTRSIRIWIGENQKKSI